MPDRPQALANVSSALQKQIDALQPLMEPDDPEIPTALILLLNALDRIDIAVAEATDRGSAA